MIVSPAARLGLSAGNEQLSPIYPWYNLAASAPVPALTVSLFGAAERLDVGAHDGLFPTPETTLTQGIRFVRLANRIAPAWYIQFLPLLTGRQDIDPRSTPKASLHRLVKSEQRRHPD